MKFFWGLIWIVIGVLLMKYTYQIVQYFGKVPWAEQYLRGGFGGTYFMYKLIGVLLVVLALFYMFGALDFFVRPLAPLFQGLNP